MQNEHKVMRLQLQAIFSHISYLIGELPVDDLVPHLVQRRLLTETQGREVQWMSGQPAKVCHMIDALRKNKNNFAGRLPTFCAALVSIRQTNIAEKLKNSELIISFPHEAVSPMAHFPRVPESPEG